MTKPGDLPATNWEEKYEKEHKLRQEAEGELLKFGGVEMDTDFPRTVLYAILRRVVEDFKPRNDTYKDLMDRIFNSFEIEKTPDTFEIPLDDKVTNYKTQKEIAKKALDETLRKK